MRGHFKAMGGAYHDAIVYITIVHAERGGSDLVYKTFICLLNANDDDINKHW